jgi:hypothetical protein
LCWKAPNGGLIVLEGSERRLIVLEGWGEHPALVGGGYVGVVGLAELVEVLGERAGRDVDGNGA